MIARLLKSYISQSDFINYRPLGTIVVGDISPSIGPTYISVKIADNLGPTIAFYVKIGRESLLVTGGLRVLFLITPILRLKIIFI
jgi:hypothetical protein